MYEYINGMKVFVMIGKSICKKDLPMVDTKTGNKIIVPAGTVLDRFSKTEKSHIFTYSHNGVHYEWRSGLKYIHGVGWSKMLFTNNPKQR